MGFDEFEAKDDFSTADLEEKLMAAGVVEESASARQSTEKKTQIRRGVMSGKVDSEDESSDFDD